MSVALDDQVSEIVECLLGTHVRDFVALNQAAQRLRYLDLEQMRGMKPLRSGERTLH